MSDEKTRLRAAGAWFLRSTSGDDTELPVSDGFTVGRSDDCDLVLSEGFASRRHAVFSVQGMKLVVEDNGSSNGTFVNDRRIERQTLNAGDRVRFDTYEYEVVLNEAEPADEGATIVRPEPLAPGSEESGVVEAAAAFVVCDAKSEPEHEFGAEAQSEPEAETMIVPGGTEVSDTAETIIDDRRATAVEKPAEDEAETAIWQAPDIADADTDISAEAATAVMPAPPRELLLTGLDEPVAGRNYPLSKEKITVGRSPLNDIILRSDSVSSRHAEIRCEGGKWVLQDRGSSNGTYVNGEAVDECALEPGDIVAFGAVELEFDAAGKPETDTDIPGWAPVVEGGVSPAIKLFAIIAIAAAVALAAFIFIRGPGIGAP